MSAKERSEKDQEKVKSQKKIPRKKKPGKIVKKSQP